jgi:hypothetical protein
MLIQGCFAKGNKSENRKVIHNGFFGPKIGDLRLKQRECQHQAIPREFIFRDSILAKNNQIADADCSGWTRGVKHGAAKSNSRACW